MYSVFVALIALVSAAPAPAHDAYRKVALTPGTAPAHRNGSIDIDAFIASVERTRSRYNAHTSKTVRSQATERRAAASAPDKAFQLPTFAYTGNVTVGSQSFIANFDTGSSDVLIPGISCTPSQGCPAVVHYNGMGHLEAYATNLTYSSGIVTGEVYLDHFSLAGFSLPNQSFYSVSYASSGLMNSVAPVVVGLGLPELSRTGHPTLMQNLILQNDLPLPQFSFYSTRASDGSGAQSQIVFGADDQTKLTGPLTSVPVQNGASFWQIDVDGVSTRDLSAKSSTKGSAVLDTGSTLIMVPTAAAASIAEAIPGAEIVTLPGSSTSSLIFPCDTSAAYMPVFTVAGTPFAVDPKDFNLGNLDEAKSGGQVPQGYCVSALFASDTSFYVLGDAFMKSWYTVFSYDGPTIKLAQAV